MKITNALIMAAGRGIRMMPLTKKIPKAMAPFNGTTLISKGISDLRKYIPNIHITVGYKREILSEHVMINNVNSIINTSDKGNCWWIFNSLMSNFDEPLFVLTCDNLINLDFNKLSEEYFENNCPDCMIIPTKPIKGLEGDYILKDKNNFITNINRLRKTKLMCSGIQILNPNFIFKNYKKTDNFNNLWEQIILNKKLLCSNIIPSYWYAVDNIKQLADINEK